MRMKAGSKTNKKKQQCSFTRVRKTEKFLIRLIFPLKSFLPDI